MLLLGISVNRLLESLCKLAEVTKQCYSGCICWKFSIWFKFDSENAILLFYF